jgi:hypothetical protein
MPMLMFDESDDAVKRDVGRNWGRKLDVHWGTA